MSKTVSFDFDGTLSRSDVQEYFKELMSRGVDCWVVTSRYDDLHKHLYPNNPTNEDLWKVIDELGLPRHKVMFRNMESKCDFLLCTNIVWHLDDDEYTLDDLNNYTKVIGVDVKDNIWKNLCNNLLENSII